MTRKAKDAAAGAGSMLATGSTPTPDAYMPG